VKIDQYGKRAVSGRGVNTDRLFAGHAGYQPVFDRTDRLGVSRRTPRGFHSFARFLRRKMV
jgi:hypothetical protein